MSLDKAPEACLWAVQQLRTWGVDAYIAFVGDAPAPIATHLQTLALDLGMADRVTLFDGGVGEDRFRQFLAASNAAIQVRTYGLGGLSGSVLDCIAAGLPTVTNAHLAEAMDHRNSYAEHVMPSVLC